MSAAQFNVRKAIPEDIAFIYHSWLTSFRYDSDIGQTTRKRLFFDNYREVLDSILSQPDTKVLVACHSTEPNIIFGYIVAQPNVAHYCFVKESFRKLGIATALYNQAFEKPEESCLYVTHMTNYVKSFINPGLIYNPFLLYRRLEDEE